MFSGKNKVIVVYEEKDELPLNYLKKLVETNDDDTEKNVIVGTEDDTVAVIPWTEKVYLDNKMNKTIENKIIFLDDIKGLEKSVIPILDVKYKTKGVSYGFSGNQVVISIDESEIATDADFIEICNQLKSLLNQTTEESRTAESKATVNNLNTNPRQKIKIKRIIAALSFLLIPIIGTPFIVDAIITDIREKRRIRDLLFIYGITKFYLDDMDAFMKS